MTTLPSRVRFTVGQQDYSEDEDLNLTTSDTTPGGYDSCSFQLCNWKNRLPELNDKILLYDNTLNKVIWLGRVEDINPNTGGKAQSIQGRGYGFVGTTDRRFINTDINGNLAPLTFREGMPVGDVITHALSFCNDVFDGGIVDGGLQLHEESSNYALHTPLDVINFATGLTSGFGTPLLWWVRETDTSPEIAGLFTGFMDQSSRYDVQLAHDDNENVDSRYSLQGIINQSILAWGNNSQYTVEPNILAGEPRDYSAIKLPRDKAVNASNLVKTIADARALTGGYISRFNVFRALNDTITICSSLPVAKPPLFTIPTSIPAYLVRSGNGIQITNMPDGLGRYNLGQKFIVRVETNWSSGVTTLQCGELVNLDATIDLVQSFNVNRLFNGVAHSSVSWPLAMGDALQVFGPNFSDSTNFSNGAVVMIVDKDGLPVGAVVHPDLIADEGIEANFVVGDIQSEGYKGAVRVIPGLFSEAEVLLGNGADFLVDDTCEIEVYRLPGDTNLDKQLIFRRTLTVKRTNDIVFNEVVLGKKDWVVVRIVTEASVAEWASISLHAKKQYPGLKV